MNTALAVNPQDLHDQFAQLRQTIADLEKKAEQGAQPGGGENTAPAGRRRPARANAQKGPVMSDQTPTPGMGSNVPKFEQLLQIAAELGAQEALGKDVQVKWDLKVAEAAFAGAIDLTKDKHGPEMDDARKLAEAYFKARNGNVIFDHKEPKQRKLISTTKLMIKLGGSPKFGVGEPMQTINELVTLRQNLRKTANKGVKLDDAHNTLMRFAREQLKRDTLITGEDELKTFCFRNESEPRTAEDWLRQVIKQAANLRQGKLSNCPEVDNSPEITAIVTAANKRLSAIAKAKGANSQQSAA